jgi:hypothetical protein
MESKPLIVMDDLIADFTTRDAGDGEVFIDRVCSVRSAVTPALHILGRFRPDQLRVEGRTLWADPPSPA